MGAISTPTLEQLLCFLGAGFQDNYPMLLSQPFALSPGCGPQKKEEAVKYMGQVGG